MKRRGLRPWHSLAVGTAVLAATLGVATASAGADDTSSDRSGRGPQWSGLAPARSGPCSGDFQLSVPAAGAACTHGPDPAPPGVDITRHRSVEELAATAQGSTSASSSTVPCYGDGTSGRRVQAVYAYADGVADRSSSVVDLIAGWAGSVDATFTDSAAKTGGVRHVRWVTSADCRLSVQVVRMSSTGDDNLSNTINELRSVGLGATDRKYLVWVDANVYCGIAQLWNDDSAGSGNANEGGNMFARVDNGCWGFENPVEAHELMHMLGGVQDSSPHSTGGGHCTDDQDRMCYQDGQSVVMTYGCAWEHERLFDCGDDDYFHTSPPAGTYLAGHWNSASSSFLERSAPGAEPPPPAPAPEPSSSTWSGTLTRKASTASYGLTTGAGALNASATFPAKVKSLTLSLRRADGTVVASRSGPSPLTLAATVATGAHTLVLSSGGANASYTLSVTYPGP